MVERIARTPDHRYAVLTASGDVRAGWYPGVTGILATVARPALVRWARRVTARAAIDEVATLAAIVAAKGPDEAVGWLAGTAERIAADAAARGGGVHAIVERLARGQDPGDVAPEARSYVDAWCAWRDAYRPRFLAVEAPVVSLGDCYGGTADAFLSDPSGEVWIVDYKTRSDPRARTVYSTEPLQVAALAGADLIAPDGIDGEARPLAPIRRAAILLLRPDGSWRFCPVRIGEPERAAFRAIAAVARYLDADAPGAIGDAHDARPVRASAA